MRMERAAYNAMQQQKQQPTSRASTGNAAYFPGTCCNPNPRLCPRHSQATFAPAASSSVGTPPASHALPIGHPTQRAGPSRPESSELPRRNPHLRPPLSFISMITKAIVESPEEKLPLNKIYEYIMTKYPYFQYNQKRWQNSVRHSLSFNDCFVKLPRPPGTPGKGSFWTMHPRSKNMFVNGCYLRRYHRFRDEERRRPRPQHVPEFRHPAPTSQSQPPANNMQLVPQNNFMYRRETFYVQSGSNAIPAASPMPAHNQALYSGEMVTQAGFPEYPQARNFNLFPEDPLMLPGPSGVAAVRVENVQVLPSQGPSTIAQLRPSIQMPGPSVVELVGEEALPNQGPSAEMRPTTPM